MARARRSSSSECSGDGASHSPPPDAFAFLLDEINHEDLARAMRNELARSSSNSSASTAVMMATPLDAAATTTPTPSYHLLATTEATEAAVLAPTELYIESDAFSAAHWLATSASASPTAICDADADADAADGDDERDAEPSHDSEPEPDESPTVTAADDAAAVTAADDAAAVAATTSDDAATDAAASTASPVLTAAAALTDDETSSSPVPTTRKKPMENSTRKRQKEELAYLRDKVVALESELGAMKHRAIATAKSQQTGSSDNDGDGNGDRVAAATATSDGLRLLKPTAAAAEGVTNANETRVAKVSLWERVAKRQLLEKQKAELKNLKLKTALEDQLKIAKSLERVLRKRPAATLSTQMLESAPPVNSKRFCSLSRTDASVYDMLLANTAKVYAEVDLVYARNEFLQLEADINDTKLKVDESNQLFMEITHAKVIPFDLQTTIDGVWQVLSLKQVPISGGIYEAVERTRDTICARTTMKLHLKETETIVTTQFVMKRFDEPHRVILACESTTQSEGPRDVVHGIKVLEKGWVVIKPAKTDTGGTLIQLCMRMTPTISGEMLESQRRHTGAITDIMLGWVNKSLGVMYQTVENILMETVAQQQQGGGRNAAAMAAAMAAAAAAGGGGGGGAAP